jgi:hypothetical protein
MKHKFNIIILSVIISLFFISGCGDEGILYGPTPTFTPRPTPWGPAAKITVSLPTTISCKKSGERCMEWPFLVTFTSENNIGGRVENMRLVFVTKDNVGYAEGGYPTWVSVNIPIPADGKAQYTGKAVNPKEPDLEGGRMDFYYQGTDANGNKFSGKISTILAGV